MKHNVEIYSMMLAVNCLSANKTTTTTKVCHQIDSILVTGIAFFHRQIFASVYLYSSSLNRYDLQCWNTFWAEAHIVRLLHFCHFDEATAIVPFRMNFEALPPNRMVSMAIPTPL